MENENEDSGSAGAITRAVQPATCACCGVKWYASREAPKIDNLVITERGKPPEHFELHVRCNDYVRSQIKAEFATFKKELIAAGAAGIHTKDGGGRIKYEEAAKATS